MEVYLIRHTTPDVGKGICYGQSDVAVKETFVQEANALAPLLPADVAVIYSSPLSRCLKLAEYLAYPLRIDVISDDRLKELNFGSWELQRWDDLNGNALTRWMNDYVNVCCPGGESYHQLATRAGYFLESLKTSGHKNAVIVSHHGVIKAMSAVVLGISLEESMAMTFEYGSITKYLFS